MSIYQSIHIRFYALYVYIYLTLNERVGVSTCLSTGLSVQSQISVCLSKWICCIPCCAFFPSLYIPLPFNLLLPVLYFSFSCVIFLPSTYARTSISKNTDNRGSCSTNTRTSTANNLNSILSSHSNRAAPKIAKDVEPLHFSNKITSVSQRTEFGLQSTRQRRERSTRGNRSPSSVDTPT